MSSNQRPQTNVGAGTLREPDEDKFTVNEGWSFFQQYMPDNSIIDSEPFSQNVIGIEGDGPYTCHIPAMPDAFLDPSSLRLEGTAKIVHVKNGVEQATLPVHTNIPGPDSETKYKLVCDPHELTAVEVGEEEKKTSSALILENKFPFTVHDSVAKTSKTEWFDLKVQEYTTNLKNVSKIFPINLMCQAMWKDVEIKLNSRTVTKNANLEYANKAYLETLMTYSNDALNTHMQSEMWCPDDPKDVADDDYEKNYHKTAAAVEKSERYCQNKDFSFTMQLHTEFNSINGFIMDMMPYTFTFVKNDPKFFLRANKDDKTCQNTEYYKVKFTSLRLTGNFVKPSPEVMTMYKKHLASYQPFLYQTTRTDVITNQAFKGQTEYNWGQMFASDMLPDTVYMAIVDTDAKNGNWYKDPFKFEHCNVTNVQLRVNNRNMPVEPLQPEWDKDNYMRTYKQLYENCSIKTNNIGLSITPEMFKNGSTIFAWDLNHDQCAGAHSNHGDMYGTVSLHMLFGGANGLPKNMTVVVWGVYRDYLAIDNERKPNVLTSYGVEKYYEKLGLPVPKFKQYL